MSWARTSAQDVRKLTSATACAACAAAHLLRLATAAVHELTPCVFLLHLQTRYLASLVKVGLSHQQPSGNDST
jgi:hypothetical protein